MDSISTKLSKIEDKIDEICVPLSNQKQSTPVSKSKQLANGRTIAEKTEKRNNEDDENEDIEIVELKTNQKGHLKRTFSKIVDLNSSESLPNLYVLFKLIIP